MRHVDLELYRWKWHHDIYMHTRRAKLLAPWQSQYSYWTEVAAFTSVLPRQVGKSTMLMTLINTFRESNEEYAVISPTNRMRATFAHKLKSLDVCYTATHITKSGNPLRGLNHKKTHLLVDEFLHIDKKNHLMHILDFPWKTVTMVSSI